jgi:hypothetical protein
LLRCGEPGKKPRQLATPKKGIPPGQRTELNKLEAPFKIVKTCMAIGRGGQRL